MDPCNKIFTKMSHLNVHLHSRNKVIKRKLDNVELDDIASSGNDQEIDYNKNNIEKILYKSTNKNIGVFLGPSNEQGTDTDHSPATNELIERINLYLAKQNENTQYYLTIDYTSSSLVYTAYLTQLRYSNKHQYWKLDIIPLVNYHQIQMRDLIYLKEQLQDVEANIRGSTRYYDKNIKCVHFEQVIEYAKLRIKYFQLNHINFQQYKSELNSIKLADHSIYEAHKKILEQSPSDNNKYLEVTKLNVLQIADLPKNLVIKHLIIHTGEKPHTCEVCHEQFTKKSNLNKHLIIHTGEKPHTCEVCHKQFTKKSNLNKHLIIHTGEKRHICEVCNKLFSDKSNLNRHLIAHTGEKPYTCEMCHKQFTEKSNLNRHLFVHTGEKPHTCEVCHKQFTLKSNLNKHLIIHTGEKPHTCEVCHKQFNKKYSLDMHFLLHTGEKPHTCEVCHKLFSDKSNLNRHLLLHTPEKHYACEVCNKLFSDKGNLNRHLLVHTGEKRHTCEVCNIKFTRKSSLNQHLLCHTREKPPA